MNERRIATEGARGRRRAAGTLAMAVCLTTAAWAEFPGSESLDRPGAASSLPGDMTASRLASLPAEPAILPEHTAVPVILRFPMPEPSARSLTGPPIVPAGVPAPQRPFDPITLTDRLLTRMEGEALRRPLDAFIPADGGGRAADSALEAERSLHAERIIGRSLVRTLDQQLEQVARTAWGMAPVFDWLEDMSRRQPGRDRNDAAGAGSDPAASRSGFGGSVGFRLGAHPRLLMRTRFLGLQGRIDVPLLEDEVRVSFERPLGDHGRATLAGAFPRGEIGRVSLTFNFSF